jgi:DNA-binding transcriptional LysR family regulator
MAITLRQLEIFIAVAETAQVTKASKKLFVTQSAVSMALAELENQLGGSLFDRHGRSLVLNSRGRYLLPLAKDIVTQITSIESIMSERNDSLRGAINVVASSALGNYILPYLIGAFRKAHPHVLVNLLVYNTSVAETMVLEKQADIGFVEGKINAAAIHARPWFADELVVLTAPSNPLANHDSFDLSRDLTESRWIMREKGSGTRAILKERLKDYLDKINVVMEAGHPEAIKRAVESDVGIACMSALTMCREVENGWLKSLRVEGVDMKRQLHIISRKDLTVTDALAEFLAFCDVMSLCDEENVCLSSPWKLQSLLARHLISKKRR